MTISVSLSVVLMRTRWTQDTVEVIPLSRFYALNQTLVKLNITITHQDGEVEDIPMLANLFGLQY